MAIFPGALPTFAGFTASHTLSQDNHASQHNSEQAEVIAVATKLGTGSSTAANNTVLRGNGAGTSTWGQVALTTDVTGTLPQANGGTGTTSATGTGAAVYQNSPTLITPTVASLTNAQHDHSNAANGGSLGTVAATSVTTNTIAASGANHISLTAGANKLVKTTVLRQDSTANTYQAGNSVRLTGWGFIPNNTGANNISESVTFGITFVQEPIVIAVCGGDSVAGTSYGDGGNNVEGRLHIKAHTITDAGFTVQVHTGAGTNFGAGNTFYQWMAIGEI